jgi:hypothetical protein
MAAARHVLILCGSAEIDGHAFCLGFESLSIILKDSICLITYSIREAIFRSRHTLSKQRVFSPDTYSLGELVDMYHTHKATKLHDKIYALLGMSLDNFATAGLEPNYSIPWETLMQNPVTFLLGNETSVYTSEDTEMAFIRSKGFALGRVSSVATKLDDRRNVKVTFEFKLSSWRYTETRQICWTLPSSTKPIKEGDVICLLQGAQERTIVRPCDSYCAIIMIAVISPEKLQMELSELLEAKVFSARDFSLIWDWENFSENIQDNGKYDNMIRNSMQTEEDDHLDKVARMWNLAQILGDSRQYEKANKKEKEAIDVLQTKLEGERLQRIKVNTDSSYCHWS